MATPQHRQTEWSRPNSAAEVFEQLRIRGFALNAPGKLLVLLQGEFQEAVLYGPHSRTTRHLDLHHKRLAYHPEFLKAVGPFVTKATQKPDPNGWTSYHIDDWPSFYDAVIGLKAPATPRATSRLLQAQPTEGSDLSLKDECDVVALQEARAVSQKRLHNAMTNTLLQSWKRFQLSEGDSDAAMFDVLVRSFDGQGHDLLVEVKSSTRDPDVRMAIGQLYAYAHAIDPTREHRLAVLLPARPAQHLADLLDWLQIGLLWLDGTVVRTSSPWLQVVASDG